MLLFAFIAAALAFPAVASAAAAFATPGRAAYCGVSEGEPPYHLICWTPNDGFTIAMYRFGRASHWYNKLNRGFHTIPGRILQFGQRYVDRGYWTCVSRSTGLTCVNRIGHGWWLGRYHGYRVF